MRSKAWLRAVNDLFVDHFDTVEDMRKATGISYMRCKELLLGAVPRWEHIEALARGTQLTATDIAALYEVNKKLIDEEESATREVASEKQLALSLEGEVDGTV